MSGPPDTLDRTAQILVGISAAVALANGAFMVGAPLDWYYAIPTVPATGPANTHFIADIGFAYIASALMLIYALPALSLRWMAALAGSLWLTLHGGLHVYEVATGVCSPGRFLQDAPGVIGPSLLVYAALGLLAARARIAPAGLPKRSVLAQADRMIGAENSAYLREIAAAPGHAFEKFLHFMPASDHRHVAPAGPFNTARIGSTLVEDCSTCAIIVAHAARADGMPRETVNAALAGGAALAGEEALAFRFGQAVARQDEEAAALGDEIEARLGRTARLELAMAAAFTRVYPAIKRGLGLTTACSLSKLEI